MIAPIRQAYDEFVAAQEARYAAWDAPPDADDVPQELDDPFDSATAIEKISKSEKDEEEFFQERVGGGRLSQEAALLRFAAEQRDSDKQAVDRWLKRLSKKRSAQLQKTFWQRRAEEDAARRAELARRGSASSSYSPLLIPLHAMCRMAHVEWPCVAATTFYSWWVWDVVAVLILIVVPWRMLLELQRLPSNRANVGRR